MADPVLVGSKVIRPSTAWASSYQITTADLPAGTKVGDRVILWLLGSGSGTTGADHPRGVWGLPPAWRDWLAGAQAASEVQNGYRSRLQAWVNVYSTRYLPDTFPVTISPTKADGTPAPTGTFWQGIITVYRPSKEPDALGAIAAFNADGTIPGSPPSATQGVSRFADGLCIGVGHFATASEGVYLTTPNGYTERSYSEEITTAIRRSTIGGGDTSTGIASWTGTAYPGGGPSRGTTLVAVLTSLRTNEGSNAVTVTGWSEVSTANVEVVAGTDAASRVLEARVYTRVADGTTDDRFDPTCGDDFHTGTRNWTSRIYSFRGYEQPVIGSVATQAEGVGPTFTPPSVTTTGDNDLAFIIVARRLNIGGAFIAPGGSWTGNASLFATGRDQGGGDILQASATPSTLTAPAVDASNQAAIAFTMTLKSRGPQVSAVMHVDCPSSNFIGSSSYRLPTLSTLDGSGTGAGGVMLFVSLGSAEELPDYADEWGVNAIRW